MQISSLLSLFQNSTGVNTDTRKITAGNIFFALKGPNFNGNQYAFKALELGAIFAVVDEKEYALNDKYIVVDDVLKTLQDLAHEYRKTLKIPFIGITGSNGKTTTKELSKAVLSTKYKTFATAGNLNNHIGVPLTLLSIPKETEIAIIELGANHEGELAQLCNIAAPTHGIITNIGMDHLEGYGSIEGVARGNSELFYYLLQNKGVAVVNSADEWLVRMSKRLEKVYYYGSESDLVYTHIVDSDFYFSLKTKSNLNISTQLIGSYNQSNIQVALAFANLFDIQETEAIKAIENYVPSNNRSQLTTKGTNHIIVDCYNANPSSVESALRSLASLKTDSKLAILGDMYELGEYTNSEHARISSLCVQLGLKAILCGNFFYQNAIKDSSILTFETREDAGDYLTQNKINSSTVLLKGSRGIAMEKLLDFI